VEYTCTHFPRQKSKRTTPEAVITLANNPDPTAITGFSDGSALGNPGPCGAGALLFLPHGKGKATASLKLGHGDNNKGEIEGLLHVLVQSSWTGHTTGA
jgi:hypothetical protein